MKRKSNIMRHIRNYTFIALGLVFGGFTTLFVHELYYGMIREFFRASHGRVWISSGGKYSNYSIIFFIILSIVLGGLAHGLLTRVLFRNVDGFWEGDTIDENLGCLPLIVGFLLTLAVLFFMDQLGKTFFFRS